jgi:Xaa-Pro aminopeptidase
VDHQMRRDALAKRLDDLHDDDGAVDGVLVTSLPNVRYLTGFTGSNGALVLARDAAVFVTDGRYIEQSRLEVPDLDRAISSDGSDGELVAQIAKLGIGRLAVEAATMTLAAHRRLSDRLDAELVPLEGVVEHGRRAKDDDELEALRQAQAVTDEAFEEVLESIEVGMSEQMLAALLEAALRRDGAHGLAFDPIVAFGECAAEPHHAPSHRLLEEGDVIKLDFGARWEGYHADMTRTIAFGSPAAELRKIHDVVREAQQAGIDAVRADVATGTVDAAARSVIADAGYGERFTHGLGHGVGLEIHEGPWLRPEGDEQLPIGAVVTVEPGVYVPGLGGVRVEDMVEVTDDGCRVLGSSTRELIEL